MRADGLLITAHHTDTGGSVDVLFQGVDGKNALPSGGGHQPFPEDCFGGKPSAGPIPPGINFGRIETGNILQAI